MRANCAHLSVRGFVAACASALVLLLVATACTSPPRRFDHSASAPVATSPPAGPPSTTPATVTTAPRQKAPVPPPSTGNVNQTVAAGVAKYLAPVQLSAPAEFGNGVTVSILGHQKITTTARRPGEMSGPAIKFEVAIANGSRGAIFIGNTVVNAQDAGNTPFVAFRSSPSSALPGSLGVGKRMTGVYVFQLPAHFRNPVMLSVRYSTAFPVARFVGDAQ